MYFLTFIKCSGTPSCQSCATIPRSITGSDLRILNIYQDYEPVQKCISNTKCNNWWNTNCKKGSQCDCNNRNEFKTPTRVLYNHSNRVNHSCDQGWGKLCGISGATEALESQQNCHC